MTKMGYLRQGSCAISKCQAYLSLIIAVFVQIGKFICQNWWMYLYLIWDNTAICYCATTTKWQTSPVPNWIVKNWWVYLTRCICPWLLAISRKCQRNNVAAQVPELDVPPKLEFEPKSGKVSLCSWVSGVGWKARSQVGNKHICSYW